MKQYLLMCNEQGMQVMKYLYKEQGIQFLEVQGMAMAGNNVNLMVTPILPPLPPMPIPEQPLLTPEEQEEKGAC